MARFTSYGTCALCGYRSTKGAITRHLKRCAPAHDKASGKSARLFHLRVEGAYDPAYWLDVELGADLTLRDLDGFLRETWLECCGHLSMFAIGNVHYHISDEFVEEGDADEVADLLATIPEENRAAFEQMMARWPIERGMDVSLAEVLEPGLTFEHEYDFGSTTYLKLKVVGEREGRIGRERVRLLARNEAPEFTCAKCGKPAKWIHTEEAWERDNPFYCEEHQRKHQDDWAFLPVVNSPRMGVCGYEG